MVFTYFLFYRRFCLMNRTVLTMATVRIIFGLMSLSGAFLMLKFNQVEKALRINGILGSIGPFVFIFVSGLGIASLAGKLPLEKLVMITIGMVLILFGTR
jgi:hypothetical protein